MNFVRLSLAPDPDCRFNYAKQISKVTHYLDGSVIYGSDEKTMTDVRSFQGGQLRMLDDFGRQLLPLTHLKDACVLMDKGNFCFLAGKRRLSRGVCSILILIIFSIKGTPASIRSYRSWDYTRYSQGNTIELHRF